MGKNFEPENIEKFPYFASGTVVAGFQRGSREIGMPTANFAEEIVDQLPLNFDQGVYYGWAQVNKGPVYKMVMSIGNNPYYANEKKTMETHIMEKFSCDFYGSTLKVVILGFLRPMINYESLDKLIEAIKSDTSQAENLLDNPENQGFKDDEFFHSSLQSKV